MINRILINVPTNASQAANVTCDELVIGEILSVEYVKPASNGYSNGSTITVVLRKPDGSPDETLLGITGMNASATYYPRVPLHSTTGGAITYDGTNPAVDTVSASAGDKINIVVSSGGASKDAKFFIVTQS